MEEDGAEEDEAGVDKVEELPSRVMLVEGALSFEVSLSLIP